MTLAELQSRYHELSISSDSKMKAKAKGFQDIIQLYRMNCSALESEPVKISMIAEEYAIKQNNLYKIIKKEEYHQKALAAKECIISYATSDEIASILSRYQPDDKTLTNYLNYLKGEGYMNRIKYVDFVSAYNLMLL